MYEAIRGEIVHTNVGPTSDTEHGVNEGGPRREFTFRMWTSVAGKITLMLTSGMSSLRASHPWNHEYCCVRMVDA